MMLKNRGDVFKVGCYGTYTYSRAQRAFSAPIQHKAFLNVAAQSLIARKHYKTQS